MQRNVQHVAASQHGVISYGQLRNEGLSSGAICKAAARGDLLRLAPRAYVIPSMRDHLSELAAAQLAWPDAVASHHAAAALWEMDGIDVFLPEITVGTNVRVRWHAVHRSGDLAAFEVVERAGLRVTDPTRTLCDIAAYLDDRQLERATESVLRRGLSSTARLQWRAQLLARPGRRGPRELLRVLTVRAGAPPTESDLETRYLQCLRDHGVPLPVRQHEVVLPSGRTFRLDDAWPDAMLFAELDGWAWPGDRRAFQRDRSRQNELVAVGWRPLRFTYEDVVHRPSETAERTLRTLTFLRGRSAS